MGKTSDAVAEGVSIAAAAARLAVRNHILVETIARGGQFAQDEVAEYAGTTLNALADEQDAVADLVRKQRKKAWGRFSDSDGTHDYRDRDTRNLKKRQKLSRGVAAELRAMASDADAVNALVEEARDAAWGDVEANLQRRLRVEGMTADTDPEYASMREARVDALLSIDLPRLAAQATRRSAAAREAAQEASGGA